MTDGALWEHRAKVFMSADLSLILRGGMSRNDLGGEAVWQQDVRLFIRQLIPWLLLLLRAS